MIRRYNRVSEKPERQSSRRGKPSRKHQDDDDEDEDDGDNEEEGEEEIRPKQSLRKKTRVSYMGDSDEEGEENHNYSSGSVRNGTRGEKDNADEEEEEEEGAENELVAFDFDADIANLKGRWLVERDEVCVYLVLTGTL